MPWLCACPVMISRDAVGDRRLERLAGEEDQRGFEDREKEGEKGRNDEREFNRGRAILLPDKPARHANSAEPPAAACAFQFDRIEHRLVLNRHRRHASR